MKTRSRSLAEKIKNHTNESLIAINRYAFELVNMGLAKDRVDALERILEQFEDPNEDPAPNPSDWTKQ